MSMEKIKALSEKVRDNVSKIIIGKEGIIDIIMTSIIAGGHVLLEDVPGTGKTMMAKSFAKSIGGDFKRIQFTPDLLPSDLTGINYYNQKLGEFVVRRGPIFTNILLADEINRATPRTQSALLECMEEKQISIDGTTYELDKPFIVIATENPVETQGTFMLPEAQLDRFFVKLSMGYPSVSEGKEIFKRFILDNPIEKIFEVCTKDEIIEASKEFKKVHVSDEIMEYMLKIVEATHSREELVLGVSPRGSLALLKACQSYAAINGRDYVTPEDVKYMSPFVLSHRIIVKDSMRVKRLSSEDIMKNIIESVNVPVENWNKNN